jgi:membrane protease YdiL (CAAX protease family)
MEPQADPQHSLPDIPVARPVLVESLPQTGPAAESISSSVVRLTPWRAVLQLVLLGLAGVVGVTIGAGLSSLISVPDERWGNIIVIAGAGLACIVAAFAMVRSAGQRPAAIGWRVNDIGSDVGLGLLAAFTAYVVMFMAAMVLILLRPDLLEKSTEARQAIEETIPRASIPAMVLMMGFVAVWEEVVFRGFLLTRLYAIVRRWWLAVPLGAVLFSLGHGYEGGIATVVIGCVGVLLGVLFVWRRSLLPAVVFHLAFNLIALLLLRAESQTWK